MKIKLSDIKISDAFANTTPKENKMNECREYWDKFSKQDRYIVISPKNNVLIDGYIQYLVLKENNVEEAEVKISTRSKKSWKRKKSNVNSTNYKNSKTMYVYGIHLNRFGLDGKEFVWRVPKSKSWTWFSNNVDAGDVILCHTKFGIKPVIVTMIEELDKSPVDFPVKKIASKEIDRGE